MHISEGILPPTVLLAGGVLTAIGTALGLKRLTPETIPRAALLTAAAFVASLIHLPLGPSSVHLVFNGLLGLMLGVAAFPAFLICLFLQAVLFQFGGLTTLGVNTFNLAFSGLLGASLGKMFFRFGLKGVALGGFIAGAVAILVAGLLVALELSLAGENFQTAARLILATHLPLAAIEGLVSSFVCLYLQRVRPEIFQ
ncbi:MAG: cobalt transporter CbiM [Thermodesulfobacteria bacterium]|nr:cobalt transporter CbiM [Thermodesulfobacteriota bacterium]